MRRCIRTTSGSFFRPVSRLQNDCRDSGMMESTGSMMVVTFFSVVTTLLSKRLLSAASSSESFRICTDRVSFRMKSLRSFR
jgi:hypothetical protein